MGQNRRKIKNKLIALQFNLKSCQVYVYHAVELDFLVDEVSNAITLFLIFVSL